MPGSQEQSPYAELGDEALVANVRRVTKELNAMIDAAKQRGIHVQSVRSQSGHFVIERAWIERPL